MGDRLARTLEEIGPVSISNIGIGEVDELDNGVVETGDEGTSVRLVRSWYGGGSRDIQATKDEDN